jgi:4,5-DOPA dioxygenase extradiol
MERLEFIKTVAALPILTGTGMKLNALNKLIETNSETKQMPVLFIGHGNPMNAIEENTFTKEMRVLGNKITKPKAILMISAHWETKGTFVTAQEKPPTIHDFGGFPQALFDVQYPAPGSKWLATETQSTINKTAVELSEKWGLDHGCWSVLKNIYPQAEIPVIQLSIDYTKDAQYHYDLAKQLAVLRKKGVLIIGSGNMVHNLGMVAWDKFKEPSYGYDWALEASHKFKTHILEGNHNALINYKNLGKEVQLAVPSAEHYLPLLYALAQKEENEKITFFNDVAIAGSLTMTSVIIQET